MKTINPEIQDKAGRFKPGQSGNPNGRPKGISITEMVKTALEEVEPKTGIHWKDLIIKRILLKATNDGDTQMLKAIWAYIDGMPRQDLNLGGIIEHNVIRTTNKRTLDAPPQANRSIGEKRV